MIKLQTTKLQKSLLLAVVIALVVGAVALCVQKYNEQQKVETAKKEAVAAQQAKEIADAKAARADLVAKYEDQRLNCEKGRAAYNLLTPVVKTKTAQPTCGTVITK